MTEFLRWLVSSSLLACLVVPWVLFLVAFSQRAPAAWLTVLLSAGIAVPLLAPLVDHIVPGWVVVIPGLEATGLYEKEQGVRAMETNAEPLPPSTTEFASERKRTFWWKAGLGIWAAGATLMLAGKCWHMLRERLRLGWGTPLPSNDLLRAEWEQIVKLAGVRRPPWVMTHRSVRSPVLSGLINPVLQLPLDFSTLDPAARAMILRHEAEHLVRRDVWQRLGLELLRTVFWFHPLFPLALRRYDLEVEKACDDSVLRWGHSARDYAGVLLDEARKHRRNSRELKSRIKSLLSRERSRGWTGTKHLPAGYLLLFTGLLLPAFAIKFRPWADERTFHPIAPGDTVAAWWRCNTGHGNAVEDWSGHGRHGRIYGARWVKDAERGPCLDFDGQSAVLALPASDINWSAGPMTIAMWLRPRPGSDGGGLLLRGEPNSAWSGANVHGFSGTYRQYGEREIVLGGDIHEMHRGALNKGLRPGMNLFSIISLSAPDPLPTDRWSHLAIEIHERGNQVVMSFYVDARLASEQTFAKNLRTNEDWPTGWWWFGRGESPPVQGNYYEGRLSDLVVLRRVLDENQLAELMKGEPPK